MNAASAGLSLNGSSFRASSARLRSKVASISLSDSSRLATDRSQMFRSLLTTSDR